MRKRKPTYHHGNLRRTVMDGALALIDEQGAAALTLREVARRAGVTHAAPYRHFADKETLLAAIAEDGFREMGALMRERMEKARTATTRLVECGVAYVQYAVGHPSHFRIMFGTALPDFHKHPSLQEAADGAFAILGECVAGLQAEKLLPRGDPSLPTVVAWGQVHGLAALFVEGRAKLFNFEAERAEEIARSSCNALMHGLLKR